MSVLFFYCSTAKVRTLFESTKCFIINFRIWTKKINLSKAYRNDVLFDYFLMIIFATTQHKNDTWATNDTNTSTRFRHLSRTLNTTLESSTLGRRRWLTRRKMMPGNFSIRTRSSKQRAWRCIGAGRATNGMWGIGNFEFWILSFELCASAFWIVQFWIIQRPTQNQNSKSTNHNSKLNNSKSPTATILA